MARLNDSTLSNYNESSQITTTPAWSTVSEVVTHKPSEDFMTMDQYFTGLKVNVAVRCLVCAGGMLGNVLNIRTFYRMGLEDSVTIAFFNLAVLDLFVLVTTFIGTVSTLCQILERDIPDLSFHLNPYFITLLSINFGRIFTYGCTYVTTFLALQRCLCVVIPFHFKGVFTRLRTCVLMVVIWGYCLLCGSVLMSQTQLKKQKEANGTSSVFVLIMKPARRHVVAYLRIVNNITLNTLSVLLIFVCVLIMSRTLRKSVQFRLASSNQGAADLQVAGKRSNPLPEEALDCETVNEKVGSSSKNSTGSGSKERLVIVQVSLVSAIFLITNTPNLVLSFASSLAPEFRHFRKYQYTFASCIDVRLTIESVNSAVNFFVYYKYNTKFKRLCLK